MFFLLFALLIVGLDQLTKLFISQLLSPQESIVIIKNVFYLTLIYNTGIAFGLFRGQKLLFIAISITATALILFNIFLKRKYRFLARIEVIAFSLVLGGAIGNLIDRIRFGYVIDFLDFRVWPVFNIADSAITVGIILLLIRCIPFSSK